jgi:fermentation-respiration switch protein FrsA (DUF1100 family)
MIRIFISAFLCLFFNLQALATAPLEAYGRLPGVEIMELSPSGSRYAVVAAIGDARRLAVISDKGEAIFALELGDIKTRRLEWINDDRLLLWSSATFDHPIDFKQAYELTTVLNIDLKTRQISPLFGDSKKLANIIFGHAGNARIDGHDYGYFVGLTYERNAQGEFVFRKDHRDLYQVDFASGEVTLFARGGDTAFYAWAVGADGSVIAHSEYTRKDGIWRLYAGKDHEKLLLEKPSPFGDIKLIGPGRSLRTVWIADDTYTEKVTQEISTSDGKIETLFSSEPAKQYLHHPATGAAIGATTQKDPGAIFFDEKWQARFNGTRKAFPNLRMGLTSFCNNLDRLIVRTDAGDDSGTFWLVDIASGKANPIGYQYPEIRAADVGPTQWITYKATDGLDIRAVLTLPPGRKAEKLPLVVLPHGGPIGISDHVGFDWWAQAYASAGYAVLQPNYRGSGGQGSNFIEAGFGQWGRKMQTDISDGVAVLAAKNLINPKRVCIVGASYGGYAALAGVTLQHDIYRCAVSVAGPADLPEFFSWEYVRHGYESGPTRFWRALIDAKNEGNSFMKTLSPAYLAAQANAPILLIHGKDDTVVPIAQSERMASALRSANKPVEFIEMQGEDHWLSRDATRKTMLKAAVEFVQKNNPTD